jgi:predicted DNA-binding transcriptional regulator AlpA
MNREERPTVPASDIAAARLLLQKMGINPADLLQEPEISAVAAMIPSVRVPGGDPGQAGHRTRVPVASEPAEASGPSRWASGDRLVGIADIRAFFKIGRTAAYELTHRPGFPDPVPISARRYRWWASEVEAFATALRHERAPGGTRRQERGPHLPDPAVLPGRITGQVRAARTRREAS